MPIPPQRAAPTRPDLSTIWPDLESGFLKVFRREQITRKQYMSLYTLIYDYCTTPSADPGAPVAAGRTQAVNSISAASAADQFVGGELYSKLRSFLQQQLGTLISDANSLGTDSEVLKFYTSQWEEFRFSSNVLNGICAYLNRHWIKREASSGRNDVYDIYALCLVMWRDTVFQQVSKRVTRAALAMVEKERLGEPVDVSLLRAVRESFVELGRPQNVEAATSVTVPTSNTFQNSSNGVSSGLMGPNLTVYVDYFENDMVEATKQFYQKESATFLEQNPVTEYVKKVSQWLSDEDSRVERYLHVSTLDRLRHTCENVLIRQKLSLFHAEFSNLLANERAEDLARLFKLCQRLSDTVNDLRQLLEDHVFTTGVKAVQVVCEQAAQDPRLYVTTLQGVHKKFAVIVHQSFSDDPGFIASLDRACRKFVNGNAVTEGSGQNVGAGGQIQSKSAELLAKYLDILLKKGAKPIEDEELEASLQSALTIFKYLDDKDVFQTYYSKLLAKRLVQQVSVSDEAEDQVINRLKDACGFEYVCRLQRMFRDVLQVSRSLNEEFRSSAAMTGATNGAKSVVPFDFSAMILSSCSWPLQQAASFNEPAELKQAMDAFWSFYSQKHNGRKLLWLHNVGRGELATSCFKAKHILQASTYQMAVLLCFNINEVWNYSELQDRLNMKDELYGQVVQSLIRHRLLKVDSGNSQGESMPSSNDKLCVNTEYTNKKVRVSIMVNLKVEQQSESKFIQKNIDEDRKLLVQVSSLWVFVLFLFIYFSTLKPGCYCSNYENATSIGPSVTDRRSHRSA